MRINIFLLLYFDTFVASFQTESVLSLRMSEEELQDGSSALAGLRSRSGRVGPVLGEQGQLGEQGVSGEGREDVGSGREVGEQGVRDRLGELLDRDILACDVQVGT